MLPSEKTYLVTQLNQVLSGINQQIDQVHVLAAEWGSDVYRLQSTDGTLLLSPLLIAKANVLVTLAKLKE